METTNGGDNEWLRVHTQYSTRCHPIYKDDPILEDDGSTLLFQHK